ncbi:MAG TPA: nicotinate-nucleotide adenylyltransferase [Chthonomonadales bacterium]|nr:nicotinate-nucleotide adenylyltransferase [Chthonomonadales bacterium]
MRLGILGGTFDPIHHVHLFLADDARRQHALDEVLFIPNGLPSHKLPRAFASAEHRCRMVELAVAGNPAFRVSRIEVDRDGPSYSIDTLRALHAERPDAEFFFITGADAVAELGTWHVATEVARLATFLAAPREDAPLEGLASRLDPALGVRVLPLDTPRIDLSSTLLRERVRQGLSIRYLTPDAVAAYIEAHGLYR